MNIWKKLVKLDDEIALKATKAFGSMPMFWILTLYSMLPILLPNDITAILYGSNTIQLDALPLLMVGTNLISKKNSGKSCDCGHECAK
jgi:hypothetical protein